MTMILVYTVPVQEHRDLLVLEVQQVQSRVKKVRRLF
jgi:hypothetical protein